MLVDFGYIQDYNTTKRIGYISHTLQNLLHLGQMSRRSLRVALGLPAYDPQGFGKNVDAHVLEMASFHLDQVLDRYPALVFRLQKNSFRGVRIFYAYKTTPDGEQVINLWLKGDEIPGEIRGLFIDELERIWIHLELPKPDWLDSVTKQIVGPGENCPLSQKWKDIMDVREQHRERERLLEEARRSEHRRVEQDRKNREIQQELDRKAEIRRVEEGRRRLESDRRTRELRHELDRQAEVRQREEDRLRLERDRRAREFQQEFERKGQVEIKTRVEQIEDFCQVRGITNLVHFTRIQNLHRILQQGLLSRSLLENLSVEQRPIFNDQLRIDDHKNAICLSISFPNYKMFYAFSQHNQGEWVILLLDATILWKLDCAFCRENAASNKVRAIPLTDLKKYDAFEKMYADHLENPRQQLHIPDNFPTHPQAEVLVFERIDPQYIQAVHFWDFNSNRNWQNQYPLVNQPPIIYNSPYFHPRCDYAAWQAQPNPQATRDEEIAEPEPDFDEPPFWGEPPMDESMF